MKNKPVALYALLGIAIVILALSIILAQRPSRTPQKSHVSSKTESAEVLFLKAKDALEQDQYDSALPLLESGMVDYPLDSRFPMHRGLVLYDKKEYVDAIRYLLTALRLLQADSQATPDVVYILHGALSDSYNEIGQRHYFSEELCLRIIYHVAAIISLEESPMIREKYIGFLRSRIGHYDIARMDQKVKMMQEGGDGKEFDLPEDGISVEEKLAYLEKGRKILGDYDAAQKRTRYSTEDSPLSLDELFRQLKTRKDAITAIHFKRVDHKEETISLLEEIFYQAPEQVTVIQPKEISVVSAGTLTVINTTSKETATENAPPLSELDVLKNIGLVNFEWLRTFYSFNVKKLTECPEFIKSVYENGRIPSLYLITGRLIDTNNSPYYPEVPTIEFFIDSNLGLALAIRQYWPGVLGTGKEEELALEYIVQEVKEIPSVGYFPTRGTYTGLIPETADLKENWAIEILSLNQPLDASAFNPESIKKNL